MYLRVIKGSSGFSWGLEDIMDCILFIKNRFSLYPWEKKLRRLKSHEISILTNRCSKKPKKLQFCLVTPTSISRVNNHKMFSVKVTGYEVSLNQKLIMWQRTQGLSSESMFSFP